MSSSDKRIFKCPICQADRSCVSESISYYFEDPHGDLANDEPIARFCVYCVAALPSKVAELERRVASLEAKKAHA
jgi:hypothetical protein